MNTNMCMHEFNYLNLSWEGQNKTNMLNPYQTVFTRLIVSIYLTLPTARVRQPFHTIILCI